MSERNVIIVNLHQSLQADDENSNTKAKMMTSKIDSKITCLRQKSLVRGKKKKRKKKL